MSISQMPLGVDVSNHQGNVNWAYVAAAGNRYGFAKATEGTYYNDTWFSRNWRHMKEHGLYRGAYHFARPSSGLPDREASFFLASVDYAGGLEPGDMLVLDMEDEQYHGGGAYGTAGNWALGFCEYLEAALGFSPIIYTGKWYIDSRNLANTPALATRPLWLAAYQATLPPPPDPWEAISFWQFTDHASVPGVSGPCDQNRFNGSVDRIPLLGMPAEEPEEPLTTYVVGPGILARMQDYGDAPATNEQYVTPDWSEAYGQSGRRYVYIASMHAVVVHAPA